MKKRDNHNTSPNFQDLKDKVKYFLAIRKAALHANETQQFNTEHNSGFMSRIKHFIRTAAGSVFGMIPSVLLNSIPAKQVYRQVIFLIGIAEQKILSKMVTPLQLFEHDVPDSFFLMDSETVDVSIVIPVHNKYHYTHRCVYSILKNSGIICYEVIIADDASSDETQQITEKIKNVRVARNETGLGFLGNCNNAAKQARGRYILFLNNDTVVQQGWLEALVNTIEKNDTIGMVGAKLVYPEGLLQEAGGIVWSNGSGWNYGKLGLPDAAEFNYVKEVDYISGAAVMIRAGLWQQLNGFDTRYTPAYYEDTDLAFEVRKAGYKVVYQPQSVVVHFEGISHGKDTGSGIKKYQVINQQKFIEKWKTMLETEQYPNEQFLFKARDRSKQKKTMVFIDHYVPQFDRDAGSKSCFQYLSLFVKMGINVKFIGDDYLYHDKYTAALQQMGIEVLYGSTYQCDWKGWISEHAEDIDWVFLNRPHVTAKYIEVIRKHTQAKIIYYGHDLHYLREARQHEITKEGPLLTSAKEWKEKECWIFNQSDLILYPSTEEVKAVKQIDATLNVEVLPLNIYNRFTGQNEPFNINSKHNLLFVGGFNHPPNEDAVCWFVSEVFPIVQQLIPDIRFIIVGSKTTKKVRALASDSVIVKGFVSDAELGELYRTCRVVVAPLRYGAGVKGKIIEAIYNRCAVVTTSIGVEGINNDNNLIAVANEATAFANAIVALYTDTTKLQDIHTQSPEYIERYFSEKHVQHFVETVLLK